KDIAEAFDIQVTEGAVVNEVVSDSPADEAGLEEGDVIVSVDGAEITEMDDLLDMMEKFDPGDEVKLTIIRDSDKKTLTVELGDQPDHRLDRRFYSSPRTRSFGYYFGNQSHAYLGVHLNSLSDQLGDFFGVKDSHGALITEVEKDSPAEEIGLKAGDVIVSVDVDDVDDADDVSEIVGEFEPGDDVRVGIVRDHETKAFQVTLGESDDSDVRFFGPGNRGFTIPDLPNIDVRVPSVGHFDVSRHDLLQLDDITGHEYEEALEELRKSMKQLRKELKEIKRKLD
ncbi:MAG: PDZ domain-containing protein, partial [Candidatus Zixiibacteriota bacterium]